MKKTSRVLYILAGIFSLGNLALFILTSLLFTGLWGIDVIGFISNLIDGYEVNIPITLFTNFLILMMAGVCFVNAFMVLLSIIFAFIGTRCKKAINILNIVLASLLMIGNVSLLIFEIIFAVNLIASCFSLIEAIFSLGVLIFTYFDFLGFLMWLLLVVLVFVIISIPGLLFSSLLGLFFDSFLVILAGIFGLIANHKEKKEAIEKSSENEPIEVGIEVIE